MKFINAFLTVAGLLSASVLGLLFSSCEPRIEGESESKPKPVQQPKTQAARQVFEIVELEKQESSFPQDEVSEALPEAPPLLPVLSLQNLENYVAIPEQGLGANERLQLLEDAKANLSAPEEYVPEFESSAVPENWVESVASENTSAEKESSEWLLISESLNELNRTLLPTEKIDSTTKLDELLARYNSRRSNIDLSILTETEKARAEGTIAEGLDIAASKILQQLGDQSGSSNGELRSRLTRMMEGQL